ncbi:MAG TPA: glycosyltransferase family 87 protein, partial [Pirellulales bacterium]|nr:glycosyltransferase family 87 protein [Pirellulales bacterium]
MLSNFFQRRAIWLAAAIAALAILAGYGFVFARQPEKSDWYCSYVQAALRMQRGERIHVVDACPYAYPPLMAMLTIPLARLPLGVAIVAWYAISISALAAALGFAWRLSGGPTALWTRPLALVAGLALWLSSRFIIGPLETRQFDTVIAALLMAGCWRLARGSQSSGGILLGLAAAMKCTPLLLVPYLVWRRWYRAAVLVAVTAVAANVLPDVCFPQQSGRWYLADWKHHFLDVSQRVPPGTWFSGLSQNQSLAGMFQRLFRYGLPLSTEAIAAGKLPADRVPLLRACVYGAIGLLGAITIFFAARKRPKRDRRGPATARRDDEFLPRFAAEISAVFALMLLASPMTSRGHYLVLVLPAL